MITIGMMVNFIDVSALLDAGTAEAIGHTRAISMATQSGDIGAALRCMVQRAGCDLRHLISSDDETIGDLPDHIHALAHDSGTRVIVVYIESTRDVPRLVRALEAANEQGKNVVIIRSGTGEADTAANRSFDAILLELGVIRTRSITEMADVSLLLASTAAARLPQGRAIGIVTFAGGNGVLPAEQAAMHGLRVPALTAQRNPAEANTHTQFAVAISGLASQSEVDSLLLVIGSATAHDIADIIIGSTQNCTKPVCVSWPAASANATAHLATAGIAVFEDTDRALRALGQLATHSEARARPQRGKHAAVKFDWDSHVEAGTSVVPENRCHAILIDAGLPTAPGRLAVDAAAALPIAHEIGLPVALRGIIAQSINRASAGLLATDLRNADEVLTAFRRLEDRARAHDVALTGIYVQKVQRGGVDLQVSVFRDPIFGTMVSCGSGGSLGELIDDVVTARAPVSVGFATDMVERLRCRRLARDLDATAPATFISQLSLLGTSAPWREFTFTVNPIQWTRAGVVAVDALLVIEDATASR